MTRLKIPARNFSSYTIRRHKYIGWDCLCTFCVDSNISHEIFSAHSTMSGFKYLWWDFLGMQCLDLSNSGDAFSVYKEKAQASRTRLSLYTTNRLIYLESGCLSIHLGKSYTYVFSSKYQVYITFIYKYWTILILHFYICLILLWCLEKSRHILSNV